MTATAANGTGKKPASMTTVVAASTAGTAFEWYDFFLFVPLAAIMARVFFTGLSETAGYVFALGAFAVGFAFRPLGALIFGRIGDRVGRKATFLITMSLMGVSTFAIGLLPGYASVGIAAPILFLTLRILQGLALGGEWGGAAIYIAEHVDPKKRGIMGGWLGGSAAFGLGGALLVVLIVRTITGEEAFMAWGWRIPFLASIVLLGVALFIRRQVDESPAFAEVESAGQKAKAPIAEVLRRYPGRTLIVMAISAAETGLYYLAGAFALAYATRTLGHPQGTMANSMVIGAAIGIVASPLLGSLSDRIGRRPMFIAGTAIAAAYIWVFFEMLQAGPAWLAGLAIIIGVGLVHPIMYAPQGSFLAELFDTRVRMTGLSLGKQIGAVLGAGLAPMIATWIIGVTGGTDGVVIYYAIMAGIAFVAALLAKETSKVHLYGSDR